MRGRTARIRRSFGSLLPKLAALLAIAEWSPLEAQCRPFQLTHVQAPQFARLLDVADSGNFLLLSSDADLASNGNSVPAIFRYSTQSASFTLVAVGSASQGEMSASGDEFVIGKSSLAGGVTILYKDLSLNLSRTLSDPAGTYQYLKPEISSDGEWIAFESNDDLLGNTDHNLEVFLYQPSHQGM